MFTKKHICHCNIGIGNFNIFCHDIGAKRICPLQRYCRKGIYQGNAADS